MRKGSVFLNERDLVNREYSEGLALACGEATATIRHDAYGYLHFVITRDELVQSERAQGPQLESVSIDGAVLTMHMIGVPSGKTELVYFDELRGIPIVLARSLSSEREDRNEMEFRVNFLDKAITDDLYSGKHELRLMASGASWNKAVVFFADRSLRRELREGTLKVTLYCDSRCIPILRTESLWDEDSVSDDRRRYHRKHTYRNYRELPLDEKTILFEAYWGAKYQCNPRYLYEYIDRNHPEYTCIWSFEDERTPIVGNGRRVRKYSREYYRCLATAKYLVNNVNFENEYVKREGQIEIQTMHGTPYKSLGFDVAADFPTEEHKIKYLKRNKRWNYLVVQGKFSEEMAWQWFRFDKTMLRTGYPRTDGLFHVSEEEKQELKQRLGLPQDKEIILYAPTFRREGIYEMPLDLERLRRELSERYILLIRLHHFVAKSYQVPADNSFIFDFGGYNNIEDLFKVTDLLVTDYSSIMFDYALTGKPMIFHTYDLDDYVNDLRGSYFDIAEEAPGAITRTDDELLAAIGSLQAGEVPEKARIDRFRERYLTYENEASSEVIFQKVFVEGYLDKNVSKTMRLKGIVKRLLPKKLFKMVRERRLERKL